MIPPLDVVNIDNVAERREREGDRERGRERELYVGVCVCVTTQSISGFVYLLLLSDLLHLQVLNVPKIVQHLFQ